MSGFSCVEDEILREMLRDFYRRLDALVGERASILSFWLLSDGYLQQPQTYPQYMIIIDSEYDPAALDVLFFYLQDKYGWPYGHYFANSYSRQNIFTQKKVLKGLKPEETYLDLSDIETILNGNYVPLIDCLNPQKADRLRRSFVRLKRQVKLLRDVLEVNSISDVIQDYEEVPVGKHHSGLNRLSRCEFYRKRGQAPTRSTPILNELRRSINHYAARGRPQKHLLYGRINGSGKSQYLYHLMGHLYSIGHPFVYKEMFYFHYFKHQQKKGSGPDSTLYRLMQEQEAEPETTTRWLAEVAQRITRKTGRKPVLLVDEDDLASWSRLDDHFIVATDKELPSYGDGRWRIYDILTDAPLDERYVACAPADELVSADLDQTFGVEQYREVLMEIASYSHIPHFYYLKRPSIFHAKRLLSLCLMEAVKRYLAGGALSLRLSDV